MAEPPAGRDAALLLDMLLAARDARSFVAGLDEAAFLKSRLHQNAVIRLDLVWAVAQDRLDPLIAALAPLIPDEDAPA